MFPEHFPDIFQVFLFQARKISHFPIHTEPFVFICPRTVESNGPQVIEQEAGIEEYDSRNRPFIWSMTGGEIRAASGLVDALVNDGVNAVKTAMNEAIAKGVPVQHRSDNYDDYLRRLSQFDTRQQADTAQIKQLFAREDK